MFLIKNYSVKRKSKDGMEASFEAEGPGDCKYEFFSMMQVKIPTPKPFFSPTLSQKYITSSILFLKTLIFFIHFFLFI